MTKYWLGKTRSEETKKKISEKLSGRTRKPQRLCIICGKDGVRNKRKFCSKECYGESRKGKDTYMKGKKHSKESINKMKISHIGHKTWNKGIPNLKGRGENCHFWKGGITEESAKIRSSLEYKQWVRKVFERDNYTCQHCDERGGDKHAHHIKDFATFKELRFELSNGITLCPSCHKKTDNYPKNLR